MRVGRASEDEEVVRSIGRRERAECDGHRQGHGGFGERFREFSLAAFGGDEVAIALRRCQTKSRRRCVFRSEQSSDSRDYPNLW
jgi:hypothetical protein